MSWVGESQRDPALDLGTHQHHPREEPCRAEGGQRLALHLDSSLADRLADRVGIRFGIDERIGRAHLLEHVQIGVADERLAVPARPDQRTAVEIERA